MSIKLGEFDDVFSRNTFGIQDIREEITNTAPTGSKVAWEYPGYISIVLENGVEIAFGESLESETGYSWNDYQLDGTNTIADSFPDLQDIKLIVAKLWEQTHSLHSNS